MEKTDKNTKIDNVKDFIREIEQREPLWKNHHKYYYNKAVVTKHWADVADLFHLEDAKQKWKNLRDTFRVEVKKVRNKSFVNEYDEYEEFKSTWSHYSDMSFLKEILKTRASTSLSEKGSGAGRNDEASSAECNSSGLKFEFVENDPFSPESLNEEGSLVGSHTMDDNDDDNDDPPAEIIHITTTGRPSKRRRTEKSEEAEEVDDDDMLFFRSLLPFIKKMDLDKKLMFRTEVQKKLYETLFDK